MGRPARIDVLVQDKAVGQVTNAVAMGEGYSVAIEASPEYEGVSLVRLTRQP